MSPYFKGVRSRGVITISDEVLRQRYAGIKIDTDELESWLRVALSADGPGLYQ